VSQFEIVVLAMTRPVRSGLGIVLTRRGSNDITASNNQKTAQIAESYALFNRQMLRPREPSGNFWLGARSLDELSYLSNIEALLFVKQLN